MPLGLLCTGGRTEAMCADPGTRIFRGVVCSAVAEMALNVAFVLKTD